MGLFLIVHPPSFNFNFSVLLNKQMTTSKNYIIIEQYYQGGVEMIRRDLLTGHWTPYLERALSLKPCYEGGINGGEVPVSSRVLVIQKHLFENHDP